MKIAAVLTIGLVIAGSNWAEAHSGRTDKNGGHNCSQASQEKGLCTGYHYHNGGGLHEDGTDQEVQAHGRGESHRTLTSEDHHGHDHHGHEADHQTTAPTPVKVFELEPS